MAAGAPEAAIISYSEAFDQLVMIEWRTKSESRIKEINRNTEDLEI